MVHEIYSNCYFNTNEVQTSFEELVLNQKTDFSRYNFFYAKYLESSKQETKAKRIIKESLKKNPRNLLLNQYKIDLENSENNFYFDCKKREHVIAEILYITANALSSQSIYPLSNFSYTKYNTKIT